MKAFRQAPPLVRLVATLLIIEALALFVVFFILLAELISGQFQSIYAEIFLLVLALAASTWVLAFTKGILDKKRWARSAAFFWQLLQVFVGAGAISDAGGNQMLGVFLVALALAVGLLLFNKKVVEETNQMGED
jgi:O-antigen ligase